jgi:hypothetical protein
LKQRLTYRRGNAAHDVVLEAPDPRDVDHILLEAAVEVEVEETIVIATVEDQEPQSAARCPQVVVLRTARSKNELRLESKCCRASVRAVNKIVEFMVGVRGGPLSCSGLSHDFLAR